MYIEPKKLRGKPIDAPFSLCILNRHAPDRDAAQWDGHHYVSHCLNCGKKIRRKAHKDWKLDWLVTT